MATPANHRLSPQEVSHTIIAAAMGVHSELGPGLLESAYQACLHHELQQAGIQSACQVGLPVVFCEWHGVEEKRNLYPLRTSKVHEGNLGAIFGAGI